jgi:KUP system potassium uptake protein
VGTTVPKLQSERVAPKTSVLALAALGIVFGDIGTSPLYAFRQCFTSILKVVPTHDNVLGVLSLILWSLILIVFVRYIGMVMRVTHDGEGGIFALLALVLPPTRRGILPQATWLTFLILLGAGMLFGDGVITPAVSVLSSVEGLKVATAAAQPFVVPLAVGILAALFFSQRFGTHRIGSVFGPVMLVWFLTIATLGVVGVAKYPAVLFAFDPVYIVRFFAHHGFAALAIFGAIVLCVSGVEALYADVSHFGRHPIALGWTIVVFPALALNYMGQGALVLADSSSLESPFYRLVPSWALYLVVIVATVATIIASQALISGVFTLAKQAISLGFVPRTRVVYTSVRHRGQVYVPAINGVIGILCIALVIGFRSSERLANAYGLAVAGTMIVTSIGYYVVVRDKFEWSKFKAMAATAPFLLLELLFVGGSLPKVREGGWIPLLISAIVFVMASTWRTGRRRIAQSLVEQSQPVSDFLEEIKGRLESRFQGTAVFLTADPEGVPFVLRHHWARTHTVDERIILLTIVPSNDPYVTDEARVTVTRLAPSLIRITARFGFMERLDIRRISAACAVQGLHLDQSDTTYYAADPEIVPKTKGYWHGWRRGIFVFLKRNARPITTSLGIPPDALAKLCFKVSM